MEGKQEKVIPLARSFMFLLYWKTKEEEKK